jgi:hypothetical protein
MIVKELFNGNDQVEELDASEAHAYRLTNIKTMYLLPIDGDNYVFYFEELSTNKYSFSYGRSRDYGSDGEKTIDYHLTHFRIQYKILSAVIQAVGMFIAKYSPETIFFKGAEARQSQFYAKLMPYIGKKIPTEYRAGTTREPAGTKFVVTKDVSNPRYELNEGAARDVSAAKHASEIVSNFRIWLARANENTPLKDVMYRFRLKDGGTMYYTSTEEFGGEHDLYIGIAYEPNGGHRDGFLTGGRDATGKIRWFAMLSQRKDPADEVDVAFSLGSAETEYLVHEITHYYDRMRQTTPSKTSTGKIPGASGDDPETYFNNALEFNAHFQQGLSRILRSVETSKEKHLDTFEDFQTNYLWEFPSGFRYYLNSEYKKKFNRRIYKLWEYLKSRVEASSTAS